MEIPDPTEAGREVAHHLSREHESRFRHDLREAERDWREIVVAFVLAFAALGSAWSAYQAASWSTRGTAKYAEATTKQAASIQASTFGAQLALVDVDTYLAWFEAESAGAKRLAAQLYSRLSPELTKAIRTWLAGRDPATLPRGGPFRQGGYVIPGARQSAALTLEAAALQRQGETFHNLANRFVLIGVAFAVTLFFGAIAGRFRAKLLRTVMVVLAAAAFSGALVILLSQPQVIP